MTRPAAWTGPGGPPGGLGPAAGAARLGPAAAPSPRRPVAAAGGRGPALGARAAAGTGSLLGGEEGAGLAGAILPARSARDGEGKEGGDEDNAREADEYVRLEAVQLAGPGAT
eukprot:CAMPEP_0197440500 /NCGR_PEP_ID=MMETSP1175-20131217/6996_1 /TAXON_ID=1003142 /ORGANISM="Triceratium dubium, Strain CCMP147" /LENGTH=112 /DNA_ID=CAMNT_0042970617 /DNA_START=438 /DNA_END=777 /DNA_ORIENTATION=+